ncbi:MAG: damage-inducible protein DinB [Bosea sp.]|uniref:DinB family protein n=1 Tax=Bosea sp. (in: a-proteobacteria) TaxID=1871050 RepID=UPI002389FC49|nr:damage-inducible protein DinB [Bosea sp. (in: a-proteobacteria)]MCP4740190.1 damage-inducible protein DinB [Bosea sp. (in: a-proteobacteria)]
MIDKTFVTTMARYNRWQNESLYGAAAMLSDEARKQDRGAFFRSIHGTFCHLLWGDRMWLSRFAGTPKPSVPGSESARMIEAWEELAAERRATDALIGGWAAGLAPEWLAGDLTWVSGISRRELTKPKAQLVMHFFNHQTHHRGQVHAMLTAAGAKPDDSDLMLVELRA